MGEGQNSPTSPTVKRGRGLALPHGFSRGLVGALMVSAMGVTLRFANRQTTAAGQCPIPFGRDLGRRQRRLGSIGFRLETCQRLRVELGRNVQGKPRQGQQLTS